MGVGKVEKISLADVGKVLVSVSLPEQDQAADRRHGAVVAVGFVGDAAIEFDPGEGARAAAARTGSSSARRRRG